MNGVAVKLYTIHQMRNFIFNKQHLELHLLGGSLTLHLGLRPQARQLLLRVRQQVLVQAHQARHLPVQVHQAAHRVVLRVQARLQRWHN